MKVQHVDHIGINVLDLDKAKEFFVDLGFSVVGEAAMEGELVDRVIGHSGVRDNIVMLQAPDGQFNIELVKFHHPVDPEGIRPAVAHRLGISHVTFEVDDIEGIVARLREKGYDLVGELVNYEDVWKLCYVRGPEELIVEMAQRLK